jgi:hypothetical protein
MEPKKPVVDDDMMEHPDTPSVNSETPTSEEDPNEFLLGDDEDNVEDLELKEHRSESGEEDDE